MMEHRAIPDTGLAPSLICLGTGNFGSAISRADAFAILDAYAEQGGDFVDTAHVYAAWLPDGAGASERTLGAWLAARGLRSRFVIGTKGGHPDLKTMHISRLSPAEIRQDLSESLDRLATDYVDLYWLHRDDPAVPVGEILDVLNEQIAAGRVRAIGASNWSVGRIAESAAYARARGLHSFCASQIGYSLAVAPPGSAGTGTLFMDGPTWDWHSASGLPVVAYSSQALGLFSGKYAPGGPGSQGEKGRTIAKTYVNDENLRRLERAQALAGRRGRTANEIALAYLLSQPFPVFPIVGSRTVAQIRASCAAADLRLSDREVAWLEGAAD